MPKSFDYRENRANLLSLLRKISPRLPKTDQTIIVNHGRSEEDLTMNLEDVPARILCSFELMFDKVPTREKQRFRNLFPAES